MLNGNMKGNEHGDFTFTGKRSKSVIDYRLEYNKACEQIQRLEILERVDSDYPPF